MVRKLVAVAVGLVCVVGSAGGAQARGDAAPYAAQSCSTPNASPQYTYCAGGSTDFRLHQMTSHTEPDRITDTVTLWEQHIPSGTYVTYCQARFVGGISSCPFVPYKGDYYDSDYRAVGTWQRTGGSYAAIQSSQFITAYR